ncbi:glycosyltransferase [Geomonas sp. RF6]|uniref:glycosyltransferase n=1 Tax=Geomonas sp. RF6 TaxID=2897342 RepID=UPI001E47527D|nr:glycosyltransferase [Geomonas sp. RF6]UFS71905.1 glycosyltransferase [Geomonas sp. RF6]
MSTTTIVVPCYNEAERLKPSVFLETLGKDPELSFLFVDDGSRDETLQSLHALRDKEPTRIGVLDMERNSGKAEAVRRGILKALETPCDYVGYWDADLATPLDEIADFSSLLDRGGIDVVLGSRVCLLGRNIQRRAWKHYIGRVFATCASLLLQLKVYDTQCGAKLFKASPLLRQVFGTPFKVNWTFDLEMIGRFLLLQDLTPEEVPSRWVEHPLREWVDVKGSKVGVKDYIRGGMEFCTIFFYLRTPARSSYLRYLTATVPPQVEAPSSDGAAANQPEGLR